MLFDTVQFGQYLSARALEDNQLHSMSLMIFVVLLYMLNAYMDLYYCVIKLFEV